MRVESTSTAETMNPAEVPANSQLKVMKLKATAASTGLRRLSMV
jgi:hypothetical protein